MSLMRRSTVPLFILLAVIAVGVGVFASRSPSALGEEPAGCNVSTVGISILTTDAEGGYVNAASHGEVIYYEVILSIPELPEGDIACNYGGGALTIELPNGEVQEIPGEIPIVSKGAPYRAPLVEYVVDQVDAEEGNLSATANYDGGVSFSVAEGEEPPEASSSIANTVPMRDPSIQVDMTPDAARVFLGQAVDFEITVSNTGGYSLSNVVVTDSQAPNCEKEFAALSVGEVMTINCSLLPANFVENVVDVTADVVGGVPVGTTVTDSAVSEIAVDEVVIALTMTPVEVEGVFQEFVRLGDPSRFNVQVEFPGNTDLTGVAVSITDAPHCDRSIGDVSAGRAPEIYTCEVVLEDVGTDKVEGSVIGYVPGVVGPVMDTGEVTFTVFNVELSVSIEPDEQIIRQGETAQFQIRVHNHTGTELTDVTVSTMPEFESCSTIIGNLGPNESWPADGETFDCESSAIDDDTTVAATVEAVAKDNQSVDHTDDAFVRVLRASTSLTATNISSSNTVLRLVIVTTKITETNDGDSPLTDVFVEVLPTGLIPGQPAIVYDRNSAEFVGGDHGEEGVMEVGETWEWRVVSVAVAGAYSALPGDALELQVEAIGHGTDILGGDVTFPADSEERASIMVPIVTR